MEPAAAATEGARATAVGSAPRAGGAPDEADPTSLAALFRGDVPAGGTPRPIFRSGVGSGAIVLVAKPFGDGSGVYGEGYKTGTSIHQGATSSLGFGAGPDDGKDLDHDSEASLKTACYSEMVKDVKWEPPAHVKLGRDEVPAIVRRGDGTYVGGKGAWRVYRVTTVIGKTRVGGCGAWSAEHPELETSVISVLKSIRLGVGAPTDRGFE